MKNQPASRAAKRMIRTATAAMAELGVAGRHIVLWELFWSNTSNGIMFIQEGSTIIQQFSTFVGPEQIHFPGGLVLADGEDLNISISTGGTVRINALIS